MHILHEHVSPFNFLISHWNVSKECVRCNRFDIWGSIQVIALIPNFAVLLLDEYRFWNIRRFWGFSLKVNKSFIIAFNKPYTNTYVLSARNSKFYWCIVFWTSQGSLWKSWHKCFKLTSKRVHVLDFKDRLGKES